ncbi:hypothetical protein AAC387_Pa05g3204 [Persea americana]
MHSNSESFERSRYSLNGQVISTMPGFLNFLHFAIVSSFSYAGFRLCSSRGSNLRGKEIKLSLHWHVMP